MRCRCGSVVELDLADSNDPMCSRCAKELSEELEEIEWNRSLDNGLDDEVSFDE